MQETGKRCPTIVITQPVGWRQPQKDSHSSCDCDERHGERDDVVEDNVGRNTFPRASRFPSPWNDNFQLVHHALEDIAELPHIVVVARTFHALVDTNEDKSPY